MTSTQLGWFAYGVGSILFACGITTVVALIVCRDGCQPGIEPLDLSAPVGEEPSGAHTATENTPPHDRASVLVETGQLSTGELKALLAAETLNPEGGDRQ